MADTSSVEKGLHVRDLLEAGLHFGHQTKRWNPKMKRFIFGKRNGIHIIDLAQSLGRLQEAMQFVYDVAISGRKILFVGTKKQAQQIIKETAEKCGQPYVTTRWLGGTLTNSPTIRSRVKRMRAIEDMEKNNGFAGMPKKEISTLRHELEKLHRNLTGIADMAQPPGAMFIVDVNREKIAVDEARRLNIPVVAMVDTNCDPDPITCVVPGNDDAIRAISLVSSAIGLAIGKATAEYTRVATELARQRENDAAESRKAAAAAAAASAAAAAAAAAASPDALAPAAGAEDSDAAKNARPRREGAAKPAARPPRARKTEGESAPAPEAAPVEPQVAPAAEPTKSE